MEILVEGLKKNSTLLSLDLSCNNIGDLGMEFIADFLGGKPPLETLRLSSNNIGDTGARTLSFKFPYSKIIYLDISKNRITETGVLDILNCLKKEHLVKGLLMRGNQIGEKAAKVIFRMLRSGVLNDKTLDIHVFCSKEKYQFSTTEAVDHIMPHYYCLCAGAECSYCRPSTVMEIRNK
ncbi:Leucine-rich repeat-containing protein 34 [Homalodisca vitripennis]|nr:Leucine-rich repeat-containing protein 34 [Homalodisca vitripennis]